MRGGKRAGAGRKKGSPNKVAAAKRAEIAASGLTPLDWMLSVLRDPSIDYDRRDKAARDAAPYVHPRLSSTDMIAKLTLTQEDWLERLGAESAPATAGGAAAVRAAMSADQDQDGSDRPA